MTTDRITATELAAIRDRHQHIEQDGIEAEPTEEQE